MSKGDDMGIGVGMLLLTIGAILVWAVEVSFDAVDIDLVGVILMITGAAGVVWGLLVSTFGAEPGARTDRRVARDRRAAEPN